MGILAINIKVLRIQTINWTGECPFSIYREGDIHFTVTAGRERGRAATVLSCGEERKSFFQNVAERLNFRLLPLGGTPASRLQLPGPQAKERRQVEVGKP